MTRHRVSLPLTLQAPWRFQMVGLRWRGSGQVEVRAALGRTWTRWLPGSQEAPAWVGAADRVQLRRSGAGPVHRLRVSFIDTPPQPAAGHGLMPATTLRPAIITRAGWGANESLRRAPPEYAPALKMVFVHHTDTASVYPCSDSARIVRGIYAYHVLANGWNDIGYNFLIDRCGRVFEGRYGGITRPVVGAHARGFNTGSAGIAMIGTFTSTPPTRAARRALRELIAWRLDLAHVDPTSKVLMTTTTGNERFPPGTRLRLRAVSGHRDTGATSCPGAALYRLLPRIAASARRIGQDLRPAGGGIAQAPGTGRGGADPLSCDAVRDRRLDPDRARPGRRRGHPQRPRRRGRLDVAGGGAATTGYASRLERGGRTRGRVR
ncbi:MAG TPA: peptidoglycan recognition protein [Gaiellales bacterium]|nr:peptidoglycan recognition protein [Gaiellales bacterium]